jgi:aminopeptidase N
MRKNNNYFLIFTFLIAGIMVSSFLAFQKFSEKIILETGFDPISFTLNLKDYDEHSLVNYNPANQDFLDALMYDIKINLIPKEKKIDASVKIKLKINSQNLTSIPLNFYNNLEITSLSLNGKKVKYKREEKLIYLIPEEKLDTALVEISYRGTPKNLGFGSFNFTEKNKLPFVYTMNEPIYASTWLPCIDKPNDKALMQITITNDSSMVSLSNGKLIKIESNGDKKSYTWKTFYPISTYLIAIYSGKYIQQKEKYISISKDSVDLDYFLFPQDFKEGVKDFSDHPKYLKTFEQLFGVYPFTKEKYSVAEFLWQNGAMEHQTLTGIGSNFITGRKFFSDMLIHELAHHWWGNAVGPKTWKDIWLNEGFATYSEALYWEREAGPDALKTTLLAKFGNFESGTLYNPVGELFSRLVYDKGAWVLHMLRREIGDENFFKSLRKYFESFKYSNASTNDFKNICEKISGKNLKQFFEQWVYRGEGIIELSYDWNFDSVDNKLVINFEQTQKGYDNYFFPLDIKIKYEDGNSEIKQVYIQKRNSRFYFDLKQKPKEIILDPNKWLLATFESRNE